MRQITKEQFLEYESVRQSGVTNMWDVAVVSNLTGIKEATLFQIMQKYSRLKAEYLP